MSGNMPAEGARCWTGSEECKINRIFHNLPHFPAEIRFIQRQFRKNPAKKTHIPGRMAVKTGWKPICPVA